MAIIKNEIPILEFDTEQTAVLNPTHENLGLNLPKKCVFAFLGAYIDEYASKSDTKQVSTFESATKHYPIYITKYKGEDIVLCQAPVGAAAATQILDWLIGYGVREVISAGSCGALEKFPESTFLVPNKALRDEGTSYHYAPPSRFVEISEKARKAIEETILEHSMKYQEVITWSTDGFFRETKEKVAYRKSEGCAVVEMECSALAACADFRGATWGMILYTADSLADVVFSSSSKCLCLSFSSVCSSISSIMVVWFILSSSCTILSVGATCLCSQCNALSIVNGSGCVVNRMGSRLSPTKYAHSGLIFQRFFGLSSSGSTKRI